MSSYKLSSEQEQLIAAVERLLADHVSAEYVRGRNQEELDSDSELYKQISELGLYELFASTEEGFSAGMLELGAVAKACGRFLLPENLVTELFCGPHLYSILADDSQSFLGSLGLKSADDFSSGKTRLTFVPTAGALELTLKAGKLSGVMRLVPAAHSASHALLVVADKCYVFEIPDGIKLEDTLDASLKRYQVSCNAIPVSELAV